MISDRGSRPRIEEKFLVFVGCLLLMMFFQLIINKFTNGIPEVNFIIYCLGGLSLLIQFGVSLKNDL